MTARVLVLGLDAFDPDYFEQHRDSLPHLSHLAEEGAWGRLASTWPAITAPAWTSAFSGMNPGKSGIVSFTEHLSSDSSRVLDSTDVKVPRLWNILSHLDRRVAVVGVPLAYPIERVNGIMVGGFMTPDSAPVTAFPQELQSELEAANYVHNLGVLPDLKRDLYLDRLYETARTKFEITTRLIAREAWDCFTLVVSESDWIQHILDRPNGHPDHSEGEKRLLEFFVFLDRYVGEWIAAAGDDAYVLVCSDHGFGHFVNCFVYVNHFLESRGWLKVDRTFTDVIRRQVMSRLRKLGSVWGWTWLRERVPARAKLAVLAAAEEARTEPNDPSQKAWFAHRYWFAGGVFVNRAAFQDEDARQEAIRTLIAELQELLHPTSGKRIFDYVGSRGERIHGPFAHHEPDILLEFAQGFGGADLVAPWTFTEIPLAGTPGALHRPDGIWILSGADVDPHSRCDLNIEDVAPLIYHLLDIPAPVDVDGRVEPTLFEEGSDLRQRLVTTQYDDIDREFCGEELRDQAQEEDELNQRLRALGYVE